MNQSPRDILRRIRSIKSTQQITRAMEMVAAVKLNKVRTQAENSRPFVDNVGLIMRSLCLMAEELEHPLFAEPEEKNIILVVIASDRGLCGTFNANVISATQRFMEEKQDKQVSVICIGKKGRDALSRLGYSIERMQEVPWGQDIHSEVRQLNIYVTEAFESRRCDAVYVLSSKFENVLRHVPTVLQHLPIPRMTEQERQDLLKWCVDFIVEPSIEDVAQYLVPQYLETQLYHCIVESLASEHAARMVSMRNASDNADEMIEDLTMNYNKARQATITTELMDIIGGVEALSG